MSSAGGHNGVFVGAVTCASPEDNEKKLTFLQSSCGSLKEEKERSAAAHASRQLCRSNEHTSCITKPSSPNALFSLTTEYKQIWQKCAAKPAQIASAVSSAGCLLTTA